MSVNDNTEAELYCIGAAILYVSDRQHLLAKLASDDFLCPTAQDCYRLLEKLQANNTPISYHIVTQELNKAHPDRFQDAFLWLDRAVLISHGVDVDYYIEIVRQSALRRKMISFLTQMTMRLHLPHTETLHILSETLSELNKLTITKESKYVKIKDLLQSFDEGDSYIDHIRNNVAKQEAGEDIFPGLRTGYNNLDSIIGGFKKGSYNVIGARSTSGKTTLMLNFMRNIANLYPDARQVFLTLEMPPTQIVHKFIGAYSSINPKKIEQGRLTPEEVERIVEVEKSLSKMDLILDGSIPANTAHIRSLTQRLSHEKGADILYIDYLTRLKSINKYQNKHLEIDEISKSLQDIALTLNIPIVCLCQLNRQVLQRTHKEPLLSDIRESGSVEEDADVVILIHRPKLYNDSLTNDYTELHVAKNRQYGDLGKTYLEFNAGILTELPKIQSMHPGNVICEGTKSYNQYYE